MFHTSAAWVANIMPRFTGPSSNAVIGSAQKLSAKRCWISDDDLCRLQQHSTARIHHLTP